MTYVLLGGLALVAIGLAYNFAQSLDPNLLRRSVRWIVGGLGILVAAALAFVRRVDIAVFVLAAAVSVLRTGRLGPFSIEPPPTESGNTSKVRSSFLAMELDHDTGAVSGRVIKGRFAGADLIDLGEMDTRYLLAEIQHDPDSMSLLESWLDVNRQGWREYFAEQDSGGHGGSSLATDPVAEAYEVLGLKPGASDDDIRAAHRELMKAMHPDHGGSSYLATKINQARDVLLNRAK